MLRLVFACCVLILIAPAALAHGDHGTHTVGAAVIVTFEGHEEGSAEGWAFTVIDPDGGAFARGMCDVLGRAVFVPDRAGEWKVRVFSPDGHGGEVVVPVNAAFLAVGTGELSTGCAVPAARDNRAVWGIVVLFVAAAGVFLLRRLRS